MDEQLLHIPNTLELRYLKGISGALGSIVGKKASVTAYTVRGVLAPETYSYVLSSADSSYDMLTYTIRRIAREYLEAHDDSDEEMSLEVVEEEEAPDKDALIWIPATPLWLRDNGKKCLSIIKNTLADYGIPEFKKRIVLAFPGAVLWQKADDLRLLKCIVKGGVSVAIEDVGGRTCPLTAVAETGCRFVTLDDTAVYTEAGAVVPSLTPLVEYMQALGITVYARSYQPTISEALQHTGIDAYWQSWEGAV